MQAGFLSDGARDWIAVIGLAIGLIQVFAGALGWVVGRGRRPAIRVPSVKSLSGAHWGRVPIALRVAIIAFAISAISAPMLTSPALAGLGILISGFAAIVQWFAVLGWLGECLPEQRVDGSIDQIKPLLLMLGIFGTGSLIASMVLKYSNGGASASWLNVLITTQAISFIAIAAVIGVPMTILETTEWLKDRRNAAQNSR